VNLNKDAQGREQSVIIRLAAGTTPNKGTKTTINQMRISIKKVQA